MGGRVSVSAYVEFVSRLHATFVTHSYMSWAGDAWMSEGVFLRI